MDYESIKVAKDNIAVIIEELDLLESKNVATSLGQEKIAKTYIDDINNFVLYLIASDRSINVEEVEAYRCLMGCSMTMDTIKQNIEEGDVMTYDFQSKIPTSLRLLVNATNRVMQGGGEFGIDSALQGYVATFVLAGKEIMRADNIVSYQERKDFELYVRNMISYIEDRSYARFEKNLVDLLED